MGQNQNIVQVITGGYSADNKLERYASGESIWEGNRIRVGVEGYLRLSINRLNFSPLSRPHMAYGRVGDPLSGTGRLRRSFHHPHRMWCWCDWVFIVCDSLLPA